MTWERFGCLEEQVVMVFHQHVRVEMGSKALTHARQQVDEVIAIASVPEDEALLDAAAHDVVPRAWVDDSQGSGHGAEDGGRPGVRQYVECLNMTPLAPHSAAGAVWDSKRNGAARGGNGQGILPGRFRGHVCEVFTESGVRLRLLDT